MGWPEDEEIRLLCNNCGRTSYAFSGYFSQIRILHVAGAGAVWSIGSEHFLTEEPKASDKDETASLTPSARADATDPANTVIKSWEDETSRFRLIKGSPGVGTYNPTALPEIGKECPYCWCTAEHAASRYESHCKVLRAVGERCVWTLGSEYLLKEEPKGRYAGGDAATVEFLRANSTIPVVTEMIWWEDDKSKFTLMKRVPGVPVSEYRFPSIEEWHKYQQELFGYIGQLRRFTSPVLATVDGKPLCDYHFHKPWIRYLMPSTLDEFRDKLGEELAAHGHQSQALEFAKNFPKDRGPFVLTHGDLDPSNVMIHNGSISAILDWEYADYYPVWWESMRVDPKHETIDLVKPFIGHYPDEQHFCVRWGSTIERLNKTREKHVIELWKY